MPSAPESNDPLLRAIADLRIDLNRLINEQVTLVKERIEEPSPARPIRLAPAAGPSAPFEEGIRARMGEARAKERGDELTPPRPIRLAPAQPPPEPADEASKARALDPRQRLDALAKHLDHRLRQANVPATERPDRGAATQE